MQHKAGVYYRKPMQSKSNIPVKKFGSDAYSAAPEQKKKIIQLVNTLLSLLHLYKSKDNFTTIF